jgi:hypothetical protein
MKNNIIIKPSKPIIVQGYLGCGIWPNKNQVDYGNLKSRKELKGYREQTNRHITIVGGRASRKIENILNKLPLAERRRKIAKLKSVLKSLKWQYIQKDVYFINKKSYFGNSKILEHRKSYIRVIEMPDMKIFYRKLNAILKTHIPTHFPHITLFSKGERPSADFRGIPIPSKTEFKKLHPKKIKE